MKVPRRNIIALSASKKKLEGVYTSNLTEQLKALEQKEADTPKMNRWQKIIKLRADNDQKKKKKFKESQNQELVL